MSLLFGRSFESNWRRMASNRDLQWYRLALCLMAFLVSTGVAQTDDVHIVPRPKSDAPADASDLSVHTKPLRVDVNLVRVPVTVTDLKNHPVTDLSKENFRLFEGEEEQKIQDYFAEDARISVGLIVDLSSSMAK